ncbi:MAG: YfhO family protein, partial [Armatimonadetes bacterium]|nr:YfhO family protein [Armatimonadota bacterium]
MKLPGLGDPTKAGPASLSLRAAVAIWALAVLVFWWPCLVGPMAPLLGDAQANMLPWGAAAPPPPNPRWDALLWDGMAQYYPWRAFAARLARQGLIPLWNPHQFCGTPFVANGQSAFFYPPNWLFYVFDVRYAFGLTAALHYFLAGCFMLLLARELGLRPSAGLVGAAAFSFGGFMVSWTALPTLMNTAAWLPGVVWSIERAFRRKTPTDGLLVGAMLAMCLLAGHLQIAAYVWLTGGLYALARVAWATKQRQPARIAHLAAGVSLAVAIAMGQLLPTLELAKRSPRGNAAPTEEGFQFRRVRALRPEMLRTLLLPDALGKPDDWARSGLAYSETCGYVGRLTLVLAICALAGLRSRKAFWFGGLAV